jgi:hypothetical protein
MTACSMLDLYLLLSLVGVWATESGEVRHSDSAVVLDETFCCKLTFW